MSSISAQTSTDVDDYDDEMFDDNASVYSNVSLSGRPAEAYKVITIDDICLQMNDEMKHICDIMRIPSTTARIILDHYNWQSHSLTEKFFATDSAAGRDAFFRDARILDPGDNDCKEHDTYVADCLICFDKGETIGLRCGHKFCRDCWNQYLTMKIVEYGEQRIPCPDSKCNITVQDATVKSLVSDPDVMRKYNRSICNNFVKCKKNLSWCTSPGCNYLIDLYDCTLPFATCKCGNQFCLECREELHTPISCQHLVKWKCDDSVTQSYLSVNTKPCPKCLVAIEKNGGCPHMMCVSCKHEFCWKCLTPWNKHNTTYQCNTPDDDIKLRKTRTQLQRLTYCWDRYAYNRQAWKDELERLAIPWEQFSHRLELKAALGYMYECRRFLMYSYAFVYYLKENNQVYILESNLDLIEAKIDRVSVMFEEYIRLKENSAEFAEKEPPLRISILDTAAHCDSLRQTWLDETAEGQSSSIWVYRE